MLDEGNLVREKQRHSDLKKGAEPDDRRASYFQADFTLTMALFGLVVLLSRNPSLTDPRPEPLPRPFRRLRWCDLQSNK